MNNKEKIPITYVDEDSIEAIMMKTFVEHESQDTILRVIKLNDKYDLVHFIDENNNPYSAIVTRPKLVARCEYDKTVQEKMVKAVLSGKEWNNGKT